MPKPPQKSYAASPSAAAVNLLAEHVKGRGGLKYLLGEKALFGLFVPSPKWPPPPREKVSLENILSRGMVRLAFLAVISINISIGFIMYLCIVPYWLLVMLLLPPAAYAGYNKASRTYAARQVKATREAAEVIDDWRAHHGAYFSTSSEASRRRRHECAEALLEQMRPTEAPKFNEYVASAQGLAVYGCGILAAAHVGGLRALERHGLQYKRLKTLAGVSAGSVVVAMVAVGYSAEELFELILRLPFPSLAQPELGALLRALGNIMQTLVRKFAGQSWASVFSALAGGSGAGMNSGAALEAMIGDALRSKCGSADITLGEVLKRYGKRLVIMVTELDSGRERQLTPERDPDLPVRVAVRMSMGVPGLMETFEYQGHLYCDGGMCNDFPMNALPKEGRLGLMIRPTEWIEYNMGGADRLQEVVGEKEFNASAALKQQLLAIDQELQQGGIYPVRDALDLIMTCCNVMMDANLMLQVERTRGECGLTMGGKRSISELAPTILTLCGGRMDPFDFNLTQEQHRDLYYSGQLCTHLHAATVDAVDGEDRVMTGEAKMKTLLFAFHMSYPKTDDAAAAGTGAAKAAPASDAAQLAKPGKEKKKTK